jgi:membrane-associated protease RseP (regulator of RpoE activity)
MTRSVRSLLGVVALVIAAALLVFWRACLPGAAVNEAVPAASAVSSGVAPFSPVASTASAGPRAASPSAQSPEVAAAPAEAADASTPGAPEADVERRQDAKIARGLTDGDSGGVLVLATPPGSVAGALHLQPGDLITAVHGQPLASTEQFVQLYRAEGLPTELTVQRGGREIHVH